MTSNEKKLNSEQGQRTVFVPLIVFICILVLTLVSWYFTAYQWPMERRLKTIIQLPNPGPGQSVNIIAPRQVSAGADDTATLELNWTHPPDQKEALSLRINLPQDLVFLKPKEIVGNPSPIITLWPTVAGFEQEVLLVQNRQVSAGMLETRAIVVRQAAQPETSVFIQVEGVQRALLREFLMNDVSDKSPFLLIATGLFVFAQWAYQIYENQRKRQQKQQEARLKQEQLEEEQKKQKIEFASFKTKRIFSELSEGEVEQAQSEWNEFKNTEAASELSQGEKKQIDALFEISSQGTFDIEPFHQLIGTHSEALTSSVNWAIEKRKLDLSRFIDASADEAAVKKVVLVFTLLASVGANRKAVPLLTRIKEVLPRIQPLKWPIKPDGNSLDYFSLGQDECDRPYDQGSCLNPMPFDQAEAEKNVLFAENKALFYKAHPLFKALNQSQDLQVVWGKPGVGKTAFAIALGEYMCSSSTLAVYLNGLPELEDIQFAFGQKLLSFVANHLILLAYCSQNELETIARVLALAPGKETSLAHLDYALTRMIRWIDQETQSEEIRQAYQAICFGQLNRIRDLVRQAALPQANEPYWWVSTMVQCAESLGLTCRMVIDARPGWESWLTADRFNHLLTWNQLKMGVQVFLPAKPDEHLIPSHWVQELHWNCHRDDKPLLVELFEHRFDCIERIYSEENNGLKLKLTRPTLETSWIVEAKYNPRRLAKLLTEKSHRLISGGS